MYFNLKMTFDDKFKLLNMIDSLIIFKLIEEFTNEKLPDKRKYYNHVSNLDYLSYDDLYWSLDSFLFHTEIGELEYNGEEFKLTLYAIAEANLFKSKLEPELQIKLKTLIDELNEKIMCVDDAFFSIITSFDEDKSLFEGFVSFDREGAICWHSICEIILVAHFECQKFLN